jgi:nucleotide-binding universal stress UspA family protein
MKIVFPTDGSEHSLASLARLVPRLAWFAGVPELALINVHPAIAYARAVTWAGKDAVHRYYEEESSEALAPATALLGDRGISYERVQRVGDPAAEIVRFAHEWNADLIAMGRHGHSAVATLLMGSVAQKVLATAGTPVLLL